MCIYTLIMPDTDALCDLQQCREIGLRCAVLNLRKASRVMTRLYEDIMKPSGLLPTQFSLLVAVRARGPVGITRLAEALSMDRTTLTRNLRPLAREGLLTIERASGDRRARQVSLSDAGLARLEVALPLWREAQRRTAELLGEARLDRLLGDLRAVVERGGERLAE